MIKKFSTFVGSNNASENHLDLEAYSYCSSETTKKPHLILWPQTLEQVRRIMLFANQTRTPITIRGSGTNQVNGSIGENTVILSSERMNKILKIDEKNKMVEVEAGVRIADLNKVLNEFKMVFPLTPLNPVTTIGGMIAFNAATKESHRLGRMENWIEEAEFIDGTGKQYFTKKKELVLGREGLTGFITRAKLRVTEQPVLSVDILSSEQPQELLRKARHLESDVEVYFLEFFDKSLAEHFGFKNSYLLFVAYAGLKGKNRTIPEVIALLKRADSVHSILRSKGYYFIQDAEVTLDKSYDLIEWCEKNNVALCGHIGLGLFYAYFQKEDEGLVMSFRSFIRRINGKLGKIFGSGTINSDFVSAEEKKELIKLKDEYDYNNILNPGKIINYR
jgi:FAD/FMN-containing dehydrogenase